MSHRHRFIFLKTRKTAGTSIELALARVCGPDDTITSLNPKDEEIRRAQGLPGPQNVEAPPLRRRAFNHMPARMARKAVGRRTWDDYYRFSVERNPWDAMVSAYYWSFRHSDAPPFEEWLQGDQVDNLAKNAGIYRLDGEIAVHRLLRYESLDADLAEIWEHLRLPGAPDLPHAKSGFRPPDADYRRMYTEASRQRVAEAFSRTIDALGYRF